MWNVRRQYRAGSVTAAGELAKYKFDLMSEQKVRWDKGSQ
jgi:hypothetical protein